MSSPRRPATAADLALVREEHRVLEDLLRRHQEALVGFEFGSALGELEEFSRRLRRHIRLEEDVLLPAYAELGQPPRGGAVRFFLEEHAQIQERVEELLASARGLSVGSTSRAGVVSLIEREARLKALLEHHEQREEKLLLGRLAAALAAAP
ncbi:MAG: hemerythrin domain-containing protein [Elusimicrobia bacterium]|nr:hemerythrin domain-containing protein [Elusimicrobiota bacterium]